MLTIPQVRCPKCDSNGRNSLFQEIEASRFKDPEGFLATQIMCMSCGIRPNGGIRLIQTLPACRNCGHQEIGNVKAPIGANAAVDPNDFLAAMRPQSAESLPAGKSFIDLMRPNSVRGGGE